MHRSRRHGTSAPCHQEPADAREPSEGAGTEIACLPELTVLTERDPQRLSLWARSGARGLRHLVAVNRATPPETLRDLLERAEAKGDQVLLSHLSLNDRLPEDAVRRLALRPENELRRRAALHPSCPSSLLESLARDPVEEVRWEVAGNPMTPEVVLGELADAAPSRVWWQVQLAGNPAMPLRVLRALAGTRSPKVRAAAAGNPSVRLDASASASLLEAEGLRCAASRARGARGVLPSAPVKRMIRDLDERGRWPAVLGELGAAGRMLLAESWPGEGSEASRRRALLG